MRNLTFVEEAEIRTALDNAFNAISRAWHSVKLPEGTSEELASAVGAIARASAILGDPSYLGSGRAVRADRVRKHADRCECGAPYDPATKGFRCAT